MIDPMDMQGLMEYPMVVCPICFFIHLEQLDKQVQANLY